MTAACARVRRSWPRPMAGRAGRSGDDGMTAPLAPPKRKNPFLRTRLATAPPAARSRVAHGLTAAAARGLFALQRCEACGAVQYPPREACVKCLCGSLRWRVMDGSCERVSHTALRHGQE